MQIMLGLPEPCEFSSLPHLKLVESGIRRSYRESGKAPKIRLPITPSNFIETKNALGSKSSDQDIIMLWAAATLCFYGFFQAGEITVPSLTAFNDKNHLSWGDVTIDNPQSPQVLAIHLKVSKTDQRGKRVDVFISRTNNTPVCAVAAVLAYMAIRGTAAGPFFIYKNGHPLTKSKFNYDIKKDLQEIGLPYESFSSHIFRIGAVISKAEIQDSVIQMMGQWSSSAFLLYVCMYALHEIN